MTDAISQYGRLNSSSNAVRASVDKAAKKAAADDGGAPAAARPGEDSVALSNVAAKAMAEPDFDRAKVESIKQAIAQGQYPLDAQRIAESFVAIERMIRD